MKGAASFERAGQRTRESLGKFLPMLSWCSVSGTLTEIKVFRLILLRDIK